MTRLLLAATASILALSACSNDAQTDTPGAPVNAEEGVQAGESVQAQPLEDILAIEDPEARRDALLERGDAVQAAMQARFENRIAPLREELNAIVAAIGAAEGEIAAGSLEAARPIVAEARSCEGGNSEGPAFDVPSTDDALNQAARNEIIGAAYLAAADEAACVYTLASGLRFRVDVANPDGQSPEAGETVRVHYEGTLPDGTVFDSSYARNEPAEFPSDRLIQGWVQALSLMKTGETWTLFIPSDLAYGPQGSGGAIGPNAALRFKVELIALPMREETAIELPEPSDG
jgi:FKBP-type peptidyl-prolyl cis-trans isomerase FklB